MKLKSRNKMEEPGRILRTKQDPRTNSINTRSKRYTLDDTGGLHH